MTHTPLIGVVDAAAWWLDQDEDELASGLLIAVAGEQNGGLAYVRLPELDLTPQPQ